MTDKTKTVSIRVCADDKDRIMQIITRKSLENILRQIDNGEIEITESGIKCGVNTSEQGVNTTSERILEIRNAESLENSGVNTFVEVDADGEWVRDMAHDLNISVESFKRKIEQSVRR